MSGSQTISEMLVRIGVKVEDAEKAQAKVEAVEKSAQKLGDTGKASTGLFGSAFQKLGGIVDGVGGKIEGKIGSLVTSLGGLPGVAAAGATALAGAAYGIFKFVESTTKGIDELAELSVKLGIGVEELQRLQHAARMSGVETESLNVAMKTFNAAMYDASTGGGEKLKAALAAIGLTFDQLQGKTRTDQLGIIGDGLNGIGDAATRSALAAEIFGMRAGPELAGLLAEGSAGIADLAAQAQGVFTEEDARRAQEFQDKLDLVHAQVDALGRSIAMELLPYVAKAVDGISDWIKQNDAFIHQGIADVFRGVAQAVGAVDDEFATLKDVFSPVVDLMDSLGIKTNFAQGAMETFKWTLSHLVTPLHAIKQDLRDLVQGMANLGLVSKETAAQFAHLAKTKPSSGSYDAVKEWSDNQQAFGSSGIPFPEGLGAFGESGIPVPPEDQQGDAMIPVRPEYGAGSGLLPQEAYFQKLQRERDQARKAAEAKGKAAVRDQKRKERQEQSEYDKAKREAEKARKAAEHDATRNAGVTGQEMIQRILMGQPSVLMERLRGVDVGGSRANDLKPQAFVSIVNFKNEQHITSPDAITAGKESAEAIRVVLRQERAALAQVLAGGIVK